MIVGIIKVALLFISFYVLVSCAEKNTETENPEITVHR